MTTIRSHIMSTESVRIVAAWVWIALVASATTRNAAAVDILVTAIPGQPYGVASVVVPLDVPVVGDPLPPLQISEATGRVFYPVAADQRVPVVQRPSDQPLPPQGRGRLLNRIGNLIREITSDGDDLQQTVSRQVTFLFTGTQPLVIRLSDSRREIGVYDVVPQSPPDPRDPQWNELMTRWWSSYTAAAQQQIDAANYPVYVENYLVAMLSSRLQLPLPAWYLNSEGTADAAITDTLKLIGGAGDVAEDVFRRAALGDTRSSAAATLPLPAGPVWSQPFDRPGLESVATEPLASRVPPECFYIRYGSFENYLWFRDLSDEYGGDLSRMVTLTGLDRQGARRVEQQLHLKTTELSRVLGPSVIADQAIIGRDFFLSDGASIGVMFQSTNAFLLRTSLGNDRNMLAKSDPAVTLVTETISGREVSLLSSPDNRVRSYLAEDDGFFLVSNSRQLIQRFLEVGQSKASLSATPAFRLARQLMPLDRGDTLFAYLSPDMLQGLIEPTYLIELRRRMHAQADMALVHVARLTAAGEGSDATAIDDLIAQGYLPGEFSNRQDGSSVVEVGDDLVDTLRGSRGHFLPIADVDLQTVTAEEAAWYQRIAAEYSARFARFDPIMAGVVRQRLPVDDTTGGEVRERLAAHVEIAPWSPDKYGQWAKQLGPPTSIAMQFAPDDIVAVQAHVASETLGPPTHLFAGIKDSVPPQPEDFQGLIGSYRALKQLPGYLGAWPQPGALDRLPLGLGRGTPIGPNLSRLIGGVYRYTGGGFSVLSFYPDVLNESLQFLAAVEVADAAQVRGHVGNLTGSRLEGWVNAQLYERALETSRSGAAFLNLLTSQLHVPLDQAKVAADEILGGDLQCGLGGRYVPDAAAGAWVSTAWPAEPPIGTPPADYVAPLLTWFRGVDATLTQQTDRVTLDAVVDIARGP